MKRRVQRMMSFGSHASTQIMQSPADLDPAAKGLHRAHTGAHPGSSARPCVHQYQLECSSGSRTISHCNHLLDFLTEAWVLFSSFAFSAVYSNLPLMPSSHLSASSFIPVFSRAADCAVQHAPIVRLQDGVVLATTTANLPAARPMATGLGAMSTSNGNSCRQFSSCVNDTCPGSL